MTDKAGEKKKTVKNDKPTIKKVKIVKEKKESEKPKKEKVKKEVKEKEVKEKEVKEKEVKEKEVKKKVKKKNPENKIVTAIEIEQIKKAEGARGTSVPINDWDFGLRAGQSPARTACPPNKKKAKKQNPENEIVAATTYKKKSIPEHIRTLVWNLWIGEDVPRAKCMCCKATEIHLRHFQAGHVIAEANGGTSEICNLRPICQPCNLAMGTRNMDEFIATFGLAAAAKKAE